MRNLIFLGFAVTVTCCSRTNINTDSETNYLSDGSYNCSEPDESRLTEIKAMIPEGMVSINFREERESVYKRLAGIPNAYLKHLIDRYKTGEFSGIAPGPLGSGVAGLTMLQGMDGQNMYATSISSLSKSTG